MNRLDYAIDILKDDLSEIYQMQYITRLALDEIIFKERRLSLELSIKILEDENNN